LVGLFSFFVAVTYLSGHGVADPPPNPLAVVALPSLGLVCGAVAIIGRGSGGGRIAVLGVIDIVLAIGVLGGAALRLSYFGGSGGDSPPHPHSSVEQVIDPAFGQLVAATVRAEAPDAPVAPLDIYFDAWPFDYRIVIILDTPTDGDAAFAEAGRVCDAVRRDLSRVVREGSLSIDGRAAQEVRVQMGRDGFSIRGWAWHTEHLGDCIADPEWSL
jgi:hypothetical protein